ncbi:MAG: lysylphosphatidylglycerol synthase domain-containing protein [Cyanobacteria bacterium J06638_22]
MSHLPPESPNATPKRSPIFLLIPIVLAVTFLSVSLWAIRNQLQQHSFADVMQSLGAIPGRSLGLAIALTALNYIILPLCDALAVRLLRHPLPVHKTTLAGAVSYGISNTIGFAVLSDSAIRYRFYSRWSFSAKEVAQIVAFAHLSFWLGLFMIGGSIFLTKPLEIPSLLNLPFDSAHVAGRVFLTLVLAYLAWNWLGHRSLHLGKWTLPHVPFPMALLQVAIASTNWLLSAGILYVLLPANDSVTYFSFFGIFALAQLTSVLSSVPGGVGVFESVMLLFLSPPMDSATLLGILLAYRSINYFLPLITSVLLFGSYEVGCRFKLTRIP